MGLCKVYLNAALVDHDTNLMFRFDQIRNQLRQVRQRHQSSQQQDDTIQPEISIIDIMDQINQSVVGSQQVDMSELLSVVTRMSDENMGVWYQSDTQTVMFI